MSNSAHEPVVAASEIKVTPSPAQAKARGAHLSEYRVAIGTPMPARLRQPIDVALAAGHPIVLTLSEPLIVYIPNAR